MGEKEEAQASRAEVKPLAELLQYQDGSIVSHVLLKNKGGSGTLFAFGQGEGLQRAHRPLRGARPCGGTAKRGWRSPVKFTV